MTYKVYLEKPAEEILSQIGEGFTKKTFHTKHGSFLVKMNSDRLECFRRNPVCVSCGIVGNCFRLEVPKGTETPHWNFYHKRKGQFPILGDKGNKLILMTKDHIIPLAKKGEDNLNNLQTMCIVCNHKKGSS